MDNDVTKKQIILKCQRMLRAEMKVLLHEPALVNNDVSIANSADYTWDGLYSILQHKSPLLTSFLSTCIPKNSSRRKNILIQCIAILINSHHRSTIIQAVMSVILYLGHAGKEARFTTPLYISWCIIQQTQVYTRLQKMGMCLSSVSTRGIIDSLGKDHDNTVLDWVENLIPCTPMSHVS